MPKLLRIEIVHLKRAVMDVRCWIGRHEEGVMVNVVLPSIDMSENGDILILSVFARDMEIIRRHEVEVLGVPLHLILELLNAEPVVAKLLS